MKKVTSIIISMQMRSLAKAVLILVLTLSLVLALSSVCFAETNSAGDMTAREEASSLTDNNSNDYESVETAAFETPKYDADSIVKQAESEQEYRDSVEYEDKTIVFSVLTYRKKGEKASYLNDSSDLCKKYSLKSVELVIDVRASNVEEKSGYTAHKEFYSAKIKTNDVWQVVDAMSADENIITAEPDFIWSTTAEDDQEVVLEEELSYSKWSDQGIDCSTIWGNLTENASPGEGVVVAVIDTGVDYTHNDLTANMWKNTEEIAGNSVDDDGNGYVDDIHGINLIDRKKQGDPMDDHGHGTHVAGIIGMTAGNGGGVGIAYGSKIMAIKAGQSNGSFSSTDIAKAIQYAATNGADVINMSFGGTGKSSLVEAALEDAFGSCVLVASAGNDSAPTTDAPPTYPIREDIYPAGYNYVIGVMASKGSSLASFSNWDYKIGANCEYEIVAPGVEILSALPGDRYARWSGTSMAAPVVSAAAAIIRREKSNKSIYSSRYIMGQLASATNDHIGPYNKLNILDSLNINPKPELYVGSVSTFDSDNISDSNNNDGIVQAGETIDIGFLVSNRWGIAKNASINVDANLSSGAENQYIDFIYNTINFDGEIGPFASIDNGFLYDDSYVTGVSNPIRFKVSEDAPNDLAVTLNITLTADNGMDPNDSDSYVFTTQYTFFVQKGTFLRGTISEDMTLTNDKLWIIDRPVLVSENVTVNVDPGTQIQFYSDESRDVYAEPHLVYLKVDGKMNFNGTEDNPISIFPNKTHTNYSVPIIDKNAEPSSGLWRNSSNYTVASDGINIKYSTIVNPWLVVNKLDHVSITQDADKLYYFYENGASIYAQSYPGIISANMINDSIFTSLRGEEGYYTIPIMSKTVNGLCINNSNVNFEMIGEYDDDPYSEITNSVFLNSISDYPIREEIQLRPVVSFNNNAILEKLDGNWMKCRAVNGGNHPASTIDATRNYWGSTNKNIIEKYIYDNKDSTSLPSIQYDPWLSLDDDLTSIYPFVTDAYLTDETDTNRIEVVSNSQTVKLHILFNRDMAQEEECEPLVTFGPAEPFTDYIVNGEWSSAREWIGTINIDPFINQGIEYIRIKDAVADDDRWLKTGTDAARFSFNITKTSAEALTLQGNGGSNCNYLNWVQDDYDTLAGYNLYRSKSYDASKELAKQNFTKINNSIISNDEYEYTDTDVEQGQDYYYYFTVVDTAFKESEPSNVVKCTPLDEESPVINTRAIGTKTVGDPVTVSAEITDNVEVTGASLFYKMSDAETWNEVKMRNTSGNNYQAAIAGYDVKQGTMQYYITATDGRNTSYAGSVEVPNVFSVIGIIDVESVSLDQTSVELTVGDSAKLTATIYPENATDPSVTWKSFDESIVTVDEEGNITAVGVGSTTVTATSADSKQSAACSIKVLPIQITDVSLDVAEKELFVGDSFKLTATVEPNDASLKELDWESSDSRVASVNDEGTINAKSVGEATITASAKDGSGKEASCIVTVKPISVKAISISPTTKTLDIGEEINLTATVYPDNATNKNVEWESSNPEVATVEDGNVVAIKGGSTTITATTVDGGFKAICNVKVNLVVAEDIMLSKDELILNVGDSEALTVSKSPSNASLDTYEWKSDDKDIAKVKDGIITAVSPGKTNIYCSTKDGSDITKVCVVEVYEKQAKPDAPVVVSKSLTTVTLKKITGAVYSNGGEDWVENNTFTGLTENTEYTFYVKMKKNGYYFESDPSEPTTVKTDESTILITGLEVNPADADLMIGEEVQLSAVINPTNATTNECEWSSNNKAVAEVDASGKVTAKAIGRTYILCKSTDGSEKTAICTVKVYDTYTEPDMPEVVSVTEDSITLEAVEGLEYRINDKKWDDAASFDKLDVNTEYEISVRRAANGYHKASPAVTTTITTRDHAWGDYVVDREPTCTAKGQESIHCTVCGTVKKGSERDIDCINHSFGEWTTIEDSTCSKAGIKQRKCEVCGFTEQEGLDLAEHSWNHDFTIDKEATCTTDGSRSIHCSKCDAVKDSEVIPAIGHDWGAVTYSWSSDLSTVTARRTCKHDSSHKESETVATTSVITKPATYTEMGQTTYTVVFSNSAFATQRKVRTNISKLPKLANTLIVKPKTNTIKYTKLKNKNQTITVKKAFTVSKAKGKVTYKVKKYDKKAKKKITVSSAGKVTIKKGLKKGTYKVVVKVIAAGNTQYKAVTKTVTITIIVK